MPTDATPTATTPPATAPASRLTALAPALVALACATAPGATGQLTRRRLAALGLGPDALDAAAGRGWLEGLAATTAGAKTLASHGIAAGSAWAARRRVALPALALGLDGASVATQRHLAGSGLLPQLNAALHGLPADRPVHGAEVRFGIAAAELRRIAPHAPAPQPRGRYRADALTHALLLGMAGRTAGTPRQIDLALAARALGCRPVLASILTAFLQRCARILPPVEQVVEVVEAAPPGDPLSHFAAAVRRQASTEHGGGFLGRVAIAQVYDAGLASGQCWGSLGDFKLKLAAAARADLLPLERYDLAGPMDATLRERSRLALGRDERHFIVQEGGA